MVSEYMYDQKISQSQTAYKSMAPQGRAKQPSLDTRKTNQAKQLLFPIKMIAKIVSEYYDQHQN